MKIHWHHWLLVLPQDWLCGMDVMSCSSSVQELFQVGTPIQKPFQEWGSTEPSHFWYHGYLYSLETHSRKQRWRYLGGQSRDNCAVWWQLRIQKSDICIRPNAITTRLHSGKQPQCTLLGHPFTRLCHAYHMTVKQFGVRKVENTRALSIWPSRASNFDSSDPMMNTVLAPASGPNSASSTYFRSRHSPRIPSGKPNWSKIWRENSHFVKLMQSQATPEK
jgi:hypothetical protein